MGYGKKDGVAPGAVAHEIEFVEDCANNLEQSYENGFYSQFGADPNKIHSDGETKP